jgi:hypothetical protein
LYAMNRYQSVKFQFKFNNDIQCARHSHRDRATDTVFVFVLDR